MSERTVAAGSAAGVTPAPATAIRVGWKSWHSVVFLCCAAAFISYIDRTNISVASIPMKDQFGWTETTKGLVLSSFFVGYLMLQVASGTLANRYGGKVVLGIAVLWWSLFTMLTPPAAALSLSALIALRIALGLGEAAVFPASINMIERWVPVTSRSRAVAFVASGLAIGTVVSLPVTGWLIREYGWPIPFYVFGIVGFVWVAVWVVGVGNGRGADAEPVAANRTAIPWRRIASTPAVWAIVNGFDIAPRYADVLFGISNTFGTVPGIIGVAVTGWLVERTGAYSAPFVVTAAVAVAGALVFLKFGSGRRQID